MTKTLLSHPSETVKWPAALPVSKSPARRGILPLLAAQFVQHQEGGVDRRHPRRGHVHGVAHEPRDPGQLAVSNPECFSQALFFRHTDAGRARPKPAFPEARTQQDKAPEAPT